MSFSPNLKVLSDWRSSLSVAFSVLRRIAFVVTSDFSFGNFDPQTNFSTITATNYSVSRARYLRINNMMWFSFDISATLAAVFVQAITVTLPATAVGVSTEIQGVVGLGSNAGALEPSMGLIYGGTNTLEIYRPASAFYTAGAWYSRINGYMEVI